MSDTSVHNRSTVLARDAAMWLGRRAGLTLAEVAAPFNMGRGCAKFAVRRFPQKVGRDKMMSLVKGFTFAEEYSTNFAQVCALPGMGATWYQGCVDGRQANLRHTGHPGKAGGSD